jgi:O-antigen/teichoic acid export membrane protein
MIEGVKGFGWNSMAQAYKVLFSSIVLIILARLISIEEFGIIGMSTVFILFFNTILNVGFDSSIIYSKRFKEEDLFSLFILNLGIGVIISIAGYYSAPLLVLFYNNQEVEIVFKVLVLSILLSSLGIVSKGYLQRILDFKRLAIVEIISITVAGVIAVILALNNFGYWALVAQQLLIVGFTSIGYLIISYNRIFKSISFSLNVIKEHLNFGYNVLLFNITNFFAQQLDVLLIGRLLGERELGIYMLAFNLIVKPVGLLVQVFNKTLFPVLTKLKNKEISQNYIDFTSLFFIVFSPLIVLAVSLSQILVPVFLTDKWIAILPLLIVLGYQSIRTLIASPSGILFLTSGNPNKQWKYSIFISLPLRFIGVWLGYALIEKSGLGVAIGFNISGTIEMIIGFIITFKLVNLGLIKYFESFRDTIIGLLLLIILLVLINTFTFSKWLSLSLQCSLFIFYVFIMLKRNNKIKELLIKLRKVT